MRHFPSAILVFLTWATFAHAEVVEKYRPVYFDLDYPEVMYILGDIDGRTALNFERAIEDFGVPTVLALSSDGGLVDQALLVGRRVRSLGIGTLIPKDAGCYSACAFVFFGGVVRSAEGELGVHQIWSSNGDWKNGQLRISDILDTLSSFDVPDEIIVEMFRTPSDEMYILSEEEKARYALLVDGPSTGKGPVPTERAAFDFFNNYYLTWSQPNNIALSRIFEFYADRVDFYNNNFSFEQVVDDKTRWAERWPDRQYKVIGDTVSVSCDSSQCYVRGEVLWSAGDFGRTDPKSGRERFIMTLRRSAGSFKIVHEEAETVYRN